VPSFAYGTALWWDFVVDRAGPGLLDALFAGVRGDDDPALLPALEGVLKDRGYDLEAAWIDFVSANLATGARASVDRGYDYAGELAGVAAEAEGAVIDDDDRHFPLAARYYRLDHPGGALQLGLEAPAPGLHLAVFAVDDGAADGPVGPAIARWEGSTAGPVDLGERPPGGYWILATNPRSDGEVVRARLCAGLVDGALPCVDEAAEDSSSEPDADADTSADADADAQPTDDALGCSCRGAAPPRDRRALASLVALALLALRRRRGRAADLDEDR
jgi:MYXO-CTERM domain-containing protein